MLLSAQLPVLQLSEVYRIDRSLILDNNQMYLVRDSLLEKASVELVGTDQRYAYVKGLSPGDLIVNQSSPSFQENMAVRFENQQN